MARAIISFALLGLLQLSSTAGRASETVWLDSLDLNKAVQGYGEPKANRSVDSRPLSIAGNHYEHGFGTHSNGILRIELNGGCDRLKASVGIDDEVSGKPGTVIFEVVGDNRTLWKSGTMRPGQPAADMDIGLTGVKSLLLLVHDASDGYFFDHADWVNAQFEVSGVKPKTVMAMQTSAPAPYIVRNLSRKPEFMGPKFIGAIPGVPLLVTVAASGDLPIVYKASGLPNGLKMNSGNGCVTGTIQKAGKYAVKVTAHNAKGTALTRLTIDAGKKIALTPPMGWNSYDAFNDGVTESEMMANANYVAENLLPYGWDTVVVDYRWYDPCAGPGENGNKKTGIPLEIDSFGRLQPATNRFPSAIDGKGFKPLADKIHSLGLKFGIHIMRGIPRRSVEADLPMEGSTFKASDAANKSNTCGWNSDMFGVNGATDAGQAWYDSIFRQYSVWGLDFIKVDDLSSPYATDEVEAIRKAIDKCGRAIVFSTSPGETPFEKAAHISSQANMWRISGDFWDEWAPLDHAFDLAFRWMGVGGPGAWPDEDMIPIGHLSVDGRCVGPDRKTRFTQNEQITMMTLWSILPSPLMPGGNLPDNDEWTRALLTNGEVLAVNQDVLGLPAARAVKTDSMEVWTKLLADGGMAVALFNRGFAEQKCIALWKDLNLTGKQRARDLWRRKDLGAFDRQLEASVPPHGAVYLKLTKAHKDH